MRGDSMVAGVHARRIFTYTLGILLGEVRVHRAASLRS